jgi:alkaline phosphatase D
LHTFLSQTAEYALRAMAWLALRSPHEPVLARELSQGTQIPAQYLSKILRRLVLAGMLESRKGRGGGNQVNVLECPERTQPGRSLLGSAQEQWLEQALAQSPARWNVIAQTTLMAQGDRGPDDTRVVYTDGWDGYPAAREKLLKYVAERKVRNPVVLGGDVHFAAACDLKTDFDNERAPVVASEFVATSVSSLGPSRARIEALLAKNPHVKFANGARRGYNRFEVTPRRWETTFRGVLDVADAQSRVIDVGHYVVEDGKAGVQRG